MKETLLLTLFTLLLHTTSGDRFNALKFGQTEKDYILFQPNMQPFETGFTTCAWIRKLYSTAAPTWFSYATSVTAQEIQIGDYGPQTYIFNANADLTSHYTVTPGNWFHNCLSWDATSNARNVYINGALVDSTATPAGRTLGQGGYLVLGNEQHGPGTGMDSSDIFGGELFKLNMFGKKLSDAEIKEMAGDMCSEVEELYGEVRVIKWEDVLLKNRTGTVTEIGSGCSAGPVSRLLDSFEKVQEKLQKTEEKLNVTVADLENKEQQLNETIRELDQTKEEKETFRADLENKTQQLNVSETQQQMKIEELDTVTEELNTTTKELDTVNMELNSTTTALNLTQVQLQHFKGLLGESANATMDCLLNTTITNHWDLLHSEEFFEAVITGNKLEVLRKSMQNLGKFVFAIKQSFISSIILPMLNCPLFH